ITVPVAATGTILAKVDYTNEICSAYYKDGATDYSGYEQSTNNWEIPLWLLNSGTLTDLRNLITPVGGLEWFVTAAGPISVVNGTPYQGDLLTPRLPYKASVRVDGTLLVTFSNAASAQSAACSL